MDFVTLALGLVKLANGILAWVQQTQQFTAGQDAAFLAESKALMAKSAKGKQLVEYVDGLSTGELDKALSSLEG